MNLQIKLVPAKILFLVVLIGVGSLLATSFGDPEAEAIQNSEEIQSKEVMPGYLLIGMSPGHYIYIAKRDTEGAGCRNGFDTVVRLRSPLYTKYLNKKRYLDLYWGAVSGAIMRYCRYTGQGRVTAAFDASFVFEGRVIASAKFSQKKYLGQVSVAKIETKIPETMPLPGAERVFDNIVKLIPASYDDYVFSKQDIQDLQRLAASGDVDALTALAIVDRDGKAPTLRRDNSYDVRGPMHIDKGAAKKATEAGSIIAAYVLARATMSENGFGIPGRSSQRTGWRSQGDSTKATFLDTVGRAAVGGHFGVAVQKSLIGDIADHWGIDIGPGVSLAQKEGLIRPLVQSVADIGEEAGQSRFSTAAAIAAIKRYYPRGVCQQRKLLMSALKENTTGPIGAAVLLDSFKARPRGSACELSHFLIKMTVGPESIEKLECSGQDDQQLCRFVLRHSCRWESSDNSPAAIKHNKILYDPTCAAVRFPQNAFATFSRGKNGEWNIQGKLNFQGMRQ